VSGSAAGIGSREALSFTVASSSCCALVCAEESLTETGTRAVLTCCVSGTETARRRSRAGRERQVGSSTASRMPRRLCQSRWCMMFWENRFPLFRVMCPRDYADRSPNFAIRGARNPLLRVTSGNRTNLTLNYRDSLKNSENHAAGPRRLRAAAGGFSRAADRDGGASAADANAPACRAGGSRRRLWRDRAASGRTPSRAVAVFVGCPGASPSQSPFDARFARTSG
jgi:hypothetical protein